MQHGQFAPRRERDWVCTWPPSRRQRVCIPSPCPPERKVETQFPCRVIVTNWVQIDSGSDGSFGVLEIAAAIRGKNQIPVVKPKFKFIFILDPLI